MFLRDWFHPPRHLLALFVAVIVLPAIALAWLAWRTFQQDKALERQRVQERLETAASSVIAGLDRRLDELARQIPTLAASADVSLPDDFLLVTIRDGTITVSPPGRALYYPRVPEGTHAQDARLASAEALEFRSQDLASARDAFRRLARSGGAAVEAAALVGLARCLRKSGQDQDALAAYDDLARLGTFLVEGVPADLVARHARCALLARINAPELTPQAAALYGDLQRRRRILDRASYAFYSGEVVAWLPPAERKQIFKKFYRGADTMKSGVKGTGIGLATVHLIVRAHRGEIHLDTTPGNGCTFTIVLPAPPPARETPPETTKEVS